MVKMYPIGIIFLAFLSFEGLITTSVQGHPEGLYPKFLKTPEPINVDISQAKNITTFPLVILIKGQEKAFAKNTGYSIDIILEQPRTSNLITGGILYNNVYVFRKIQIYWASSADGVAATTVNGKNGTPVEVSLLYYNKKYKSFHNALKHRNGIAEIIFRITVESRFNPGFIQFGKSLQKIRKAGSETPTNTAFTYFFLLPPTTNYTAYPGAYRNQSTGKIFYCTTTIVVPVNSAHFISKQQFQETFLKLLDYNDKPLINQRQQVPQGRRSLFQTRGVATIPNVLIKAPSRMGQ